MAAIIAQAPIALHNPFDALESEFHRRAADEDLVVPQEENQENGELDLSSWCVVNSDDEDDDDEDEMGEQYLWQPPAADTTTKTTSTTAATTTVAQTFPLRLTSTADGFTDISRATATHSTNSASARALDGAWVVKVSKKRSKPQSEDSGDDQQQQQQQLAKPTGSTKVSTLDTTTITTITTTTPRPLEKKRTKSVTHVKDHDNEDGDNNSGDDDEEVEEVEEEEEATQLYMSMTEHELSKSSKASKIKNSRLATLHDRELVKALGCFSSQPTHGSSGGDPQPTTLTPTHHNTKKLDRKAIRLRSQDKKHAKSMAKTNNNTNHNGKEDLGDY